MQTLIQRVMKLSKMKVLCLCWTMVVNDDKGARVECAAGRIGRIELRYRRTLLGLYRPLGIKLRKSVKNNTWTKLHFL